MQDSPCYKMLQDVKSLVTAIDMNGRLTHCFVRLSVQVAETLSLERNRGK